MDIDFAIAALTCMSVSQPPLSQMSLSLMSRWNWANRLLDSGFCFSSLGLDWTEDLYWTGSLTQMEDWVNTLNWLNLEKILCCSTFDHHDTL